MVVKKKEEEGDKGMIYWFLSSHWAGCVRILTGDDDARTRTRLPETWWACSLLNGRMELLTTILRSLKLGVDGWDVATCPI